MVALCAVIGLCVACQSPPPRKHPHEGILALWRSYSALPDKRALAIAGDPDREWVAGAAGGEATRRDAERQALRECQARRLDRRLRVPCLLYATGDKIVWKGW